jgi:hypothetical protein
LPLVQIPDLSFGYGMLLLLLIVSVPFSLFL